MSVDIIAAYAQEIVKQSTDLGYC